MLYSRKLLHSPFAIRDKFFDLDFTLLFSILLLELLVFSHNIHQVEDNLIIIPKAMQ